MYLSETVAGRTAGGPTLSLLPDAQLQLRPSALSCGSESSWTISQPQHSPKEADRGKSAEVLQNSVSESEWAAHGLVAPEPCRVIRN